LVPPGERPKDPIPRSNFWIPERSEDLVLTSRFTTGLFSVSKQISCEAIDLFYKQNAFVRVEITWTEKIFEFMKQCSECIPMFVARAGEKNCRGHALNMTIQCKVAKGEKRREKKYVKGVAALTDPETVSGVFAGRWHFLQQMNSAI